MLNVENLLLPLDPSCLSSRLGAILSPLFHGNGGNVLNYQNFSTLP